MAMLRSSHGMSTWSQKLPFRMAAQCDSALSRGRPFRSPCRASEISSWGGPSERRFRESYPRCLIVLSKIGDQNEKPTDGDFPLVVRFAPKAAILERPAFVPKLRSCRNSTAALLGFTNEMGRLPVPCPQSQQLNHRSRLRPSAPWWSRAAGIAGRDDAARAGRDARRDRGRAWIAAPPDR
jgi:hypothetical protein